MSIPPTGQVLAPSPDIAWDELPPLAGAMFNPAVIASLLARAADGYTTRAPSGMPWTLSFLATPLVLHHSTREALPTGKRLPHVASWVQKNPLLCAAFPMQAQATVAAVRLALRFGLRHHVLRLTEDRLHAHMHIQDLVPEHPELADILIHAHHVGRWLSTVDASTAFSLLGVAP